jgi:Flp pilus assembly CpaF family ATPase
MRFCSILDDCKLHKRNSILISGGSSGCETTMVHITKFFFGPEGRVVATWPTANVEIVKGLDADELVYHITHKPVKEHVSKGVRSSKV